MLLVQRLSLFLLSAHFTLGFMLASFVGVGIIMFATSPVRLGPSGMLVAFGMYYAWFLALFLGAAHVWRAYAGSVGGVGEHRRTLSGREVILAAAWAFMPLIILALQSIGQLYLTSAGLVILFELLATIYILRR